MNMEPSSTSATTTSSSSPSSSHRGGGGRELQGPRPAPLRLRKDSHKIRKPPPPQQVREPVIIYTVSPKVVHADASEFMSVVQRLTGGTAASSSSSSSVVPDPVAAPHQIPPPSSFPFFGGQQSALLPPPAPHFPFQLQHQHQQAVGPHDLVVQQQVISPAARLAAIEQARSSVVGGVLPPFPSILSPGPLPPIQPSFFSPAAGAGGGGINLFGELISPAAAFLGATTGAATQQAGATASHHQNLVMSSSQAAAEASPSGGAYYYWDLFNNLNQHQN